MWYIILYNHCCSWCSKYCRLLESILEIPVQVKIDNHSIGRQSYRLLITIIQNIQAQPKSPVKAVTEICEKLHAKEKGEIKRYNNAIKTRQIYKSKTTKKLKKTRAG